MTGGRPLERECLEAVAEETSGRPLGFVRSVHMILLRWRLCALVGSMDMGAGWA